MLPYVLSIFSFEKLLTKVCDFLWSGPLLILLLSTHLFLTFQFFPQKKLFYALKLSVTPEENTQTMSGFKTLATTLAATLGTGNIVGVSSALALGGPGALFWCFLTGLLGMATAYCECYLSCLYAHVKRKDGLRDFQEGLMKEMPGGPMYVMERGLHKRWLGKFYAFLITLSAFLVGSTTQTAAMADAAYSTWKISPHIIGMGAAILVGAVILGGVNSIGNFCSKLVPVLSILYMLSCLYLIWQNRSFFPAAVSLLFSSAFHFKSCAGGIIGSSFFIAARFGIARGLFTNEAGIGTAAIAAGNSGTSSPMRQALISMTAVFWDTIVMCTLTGFAILTVTLAHPGCVEGYTQAGLTSAAFSYLPFFGKEFLTLCLIAFAIATLVGWCYLGEQGFVYFFGKDYCNSYHLLYIVMIYIGAILPISFVFGLTDFINALLVLPNVLTLFLLYKKIKSPSQKLPK